MVQDNVKRDVLLGASNLKEVGPHLEEEGYEVVNLCKGGWMISPESVSDIVKQLQGTGWMPCGPFQPKTVCTLPGKGVGLLQKLMLILSKNSKMETLAGPNAPVLLLSLFQDPGGGSSGGASAPRWGALSLFLGRAGESSTKSGLIGQTVPMLRDGGSRLSAP